MVKCCFRITIWSNTNLHNRATITVVTMNITAAVRPAAAPGDSLLGDTDVGTSVKWIWTGVLWVQYLLVASLMIISKFILIWQKEQSCADHRISTQKKHSKRTCLRRCLVCSMPQMVPWGAWNSLAKAFIICYPHQVQPPKLNEQIKYNNVSCWISDLYQNSIKIFETLF